LPAENLPDILFTMKDFILHFIAYFSITFFFALGTRSILDPWVLLIITFSLGLGIEIFQPILTIGRFFSFYDILSNTFGLIFGFIFARFLGNRIFAS
jgi:VanZ family protein